MPICFTINYQLQIPVKIINLFPTENMKDTLRWPEIYQSGCDSFMAAVLLTLTPHERSLLAFCS